MKRKNIIPYEPVGRMMEGFGAERVSQDAKVAMVDYLEEYAEKIGRLAAKYAAHAGRVTIIDKDIELAEKQLN
ncbi:MAG: histone [archaeon]